MNPLTEYFEHNPGRLINKWQHYFDIYHRHLAQFRGQKCTLVEFGVFHGGSLQMWKHYLGSQAHVIGVDIDPRLGDLGEPGIEIVIGDQGDRAFLKSLVERIGPIDVVIDDGGHRMQQQIATFETLFPTVVDGGVLIVEDTHTSYWAEYGGGFREPQSFIEFSKRIVDELHAWHRRDRDPRRFSPSLFARTIKALHFYDSLVVVEKGAHPPPREVLSGIPSFPIDTPMDPPSG
jgi:hypothetical protein